ncbi:winged helix-turn-helix domain-containing protein [Azohydromonas australica]|uniref:winged helix-turn-helix domain-containing protein n=1 Tax=Azohydromonas australica TaxID=364039 RepID=UPI0003FA0561|nr:LysR family transcriptional regulator [Azohydromonas australica]
MKAKVQLRLRIYRGDVVAIGPGKVSLLEAIAETGSISAAARSMGMSYRRAWMLVDEMTRSLRTPPVNTATGGAHGGGAVLTPAGEKLIRHYRGIEERLLAAAKDDITALKGMLAP